MDSSVRVCCLSNVTCLCLNDNITVQVASFGGWECVRCTKSSPNTLANQTEAELCASCAADSIIGNYWPAALLVVVNLMSLPGLAWPAPGGMTVSTCPFVCPSVCLFVCHETCERDIVKTNELILMQIGTSARRRKGMIWSTLRVRRSKVKVLRGQR